MLAEDLNGDPEEGWVAAVQPRISEAPPNAPQQKNDLAELRARLPAQLQFLASDGCNPDFAMEQVQVQALTATVSKSRTFGGSVSQAWLRGFLKKHVYNWPVQFLVYLVIFSDIILVPVGWIHEIDDRDLVYFDMVTFVVLTSDVLARFYVEGWKFLRSKMNIFELILVPIALAEMLFKLIFVWNQQFVPMLKATRPVFRIIRLLRALMRTGAKGHKYLEKLRHTVSGDRMRFTEDGFDLDLAYITPQIIAMSLPGVGSETMLHNSFTEVARFLNQRHRNKYLVLNTMMERRYSTAPLFGRYYHFPIPKDGTPLLDKLMQLCKDVDQFLRADPSHLVAVHSKYGQGRCSMIVLALLIYSGRQSSVNKAIAFYEFKRLLEETRGMGSTQTLDNASQRRLLECFAIMCNVHSDTILDTRKAKLRRVQLSGLPNVEGVDISVFGNAPSKGAKGANSPNADEVISNAGDPMNEGGILDNDGRIDIPEKALEEEVSRALEEAALDSTLAGCVPARGKPLVSTLPDSKANANVTARSPEALNPLAPGIWDIRNTPLQGELRVEVHWTAKDDDVVEQKPPLRVRLMRLLLPRRFWKYFRTEQHEAHFFTRGMLFCCWLHTNFLELEESHDIPSRLRPKTVVTVVLDRFHLDKAANAPSLRSHSAALKLQVEFEVDRRLDVHNMLSGDGDRDDQLLTSEWLASSECSMGWLTWVFQKIWPSFGKGFEKLVRESILPSVQESLPGPLKSIILSEFSLGDGFPEFGPVSACSRHHDGFEVQIDFGLDYSTEANILLEHPMVCLGIEHVGIKGMLSIKFKPLLQELPVFAALQLLFLNPPEVDLKFKTPGDIANFSLVHDVIFSGIDKALRDLMVLPNIININWGDPSNDNTLNFQSVFPSSVVRVEVMEAQNLHGHSSFKRLPDVRVDVSLGDQTGRTGVAKQSVNPTWRQEFDFLVYDDRQQMSAGLFEVDFTGRGTSMGKVQKVTVSKLADAGTEGMWVDVEDRSQGICGQLRLKATIFDLCADARQVRKFLGTERGDSMGTDTLSLQQQDASIAEHGGRLPPLPNASRSSPSLPSAAVVATSPADPRQEHSVAVLVCEVFGGCLPPEIAQPKVAQLRVSIGRSSGTKQCAEAKKADPGPMGEKCQRSIERLADRGLAADKIAEALGEDLASVHRVARKRGWNLEMLQKVPILVYASDLRASSSLVVEVLSQKNCAARGELSLENLVQGYNARHADVISCKSTSGDAKVDLDIEFRLFAMTEHQHEAGETPVPPRRKERRTTTLKQQF